MERIDEMGGPLAAIESGFIQREIQDAAYRTQMEIERGEMIVVGVNEFRTEEPTSLERLEVDPSVELAQRSRLVDLRKRRDNSRAASLLDSLTQAATGGGNLMPPLIECVECDLTLGEICDRLRDIWGEYQPSSFI